MIKKGIIPILAFGHGLNDMLAGYLLGCISGKQSVTEVSISLFIYNLLAFGGQYPVAIWIEKYVNKKYFLCFSYLLNAMAVVFMNSIPHLSIVLIGIASAIYHVAGGAVCARENKAVNIGLFAAPGVAGLIAGGYFAWAGYHLTNILTVAVFLFFVLTFFLDLAVGETNRQTDIAQPAVTADRHDIIMILLLTVISLRSALWNIYQFIHENNYEWLAAIAIAAFIGKIAGGWLADRIGLKLYIFISLFTATPLITFFKNEILPFCIGIALLQSGIPATTALLIDSAKGKTERGISLSFGTAVILGAFIFSFPSSLLLQDNFTIAVLIIMSMIILMFIYVRNTRRHRVI